MDEADKSALRERVMAIATADVDRNHPNEPERAIRIGYRAAYYLSELAWELQCEVSPALKRTEFVATDNPHANKLTIHILAAVAQHEREAISQRTKEALAAAKARGGERWSAYSSAKKSRLDELRDRINANRTAAANQFAVNILPIIREIQNSGVSSLRGIAKALTARGIKTARGGQWSAVQVTDILGRAE